MPTELRFRYHFIRHGYSGSDDHATLGDALRRAQADIDEEAAHPLRIDRDGAEYMEFKMQPNGPQKWMPVAKATKDRKVEPALSAEEWTKAHAEVLAEDGAPPSTLARMIALLNASYPDSDHRKITREWITALRDEAEYNATYVEGHGGLAPDHEALFRTIASALESYLPPEGA